MSAERNLRISKLLSLALRHEPAALALTLDGAGFASVPLSVDEATARTVAGRRKGALVLLRVHARAMHDAGHAFYLSANGVWLTDAVPPVYLA